MEVKMNKEIRNYQAGMYFQDENADEAWVYFRNRR